MLPEQTVANKWNVIFKGGNVTSTTIRSAEDLIDQLPPESPLRVRLKDELRELRNVAAEGDKAADSQP